MEITDLKDSAALLTRYYTIQKKGELKLYNEGVPRSSWSTEIPTKVYNKYQGPKIVAPFHLLLVLKNLNDFKI